MAKSRNSEFHLRWNTIWDDDFPEEWLVFIRQTKFSIQQELREKLEQGIKCTPPYVSASYANFLRDYNDKYCKYWNERPPENLLEDYFSLLDKHCFHDVMRTTQFKDGNYRPSWCYDVIFKLLFKTMENYRISKYPLTLLQLCRAMLRKGDAHCTLQVCYEKVDDGNFALKKKLFHSRESNFNLD